MFDEDGPLSQLSRTMAEVVTRARDERRPRLEDVARVVDHAFTRLTEQGEMDIRQVRQGPDGYEWHDVSLASMGFEKAYVLTGSTLEGAEGYPLMTIRQVVAPHFDAQLTFSSLIFGPSDDEIARAVAMLITNHAAAFQGLRETITTIASEGTGAALEQIRRARDELDAQADVTAVVPKKGDLN